MRDRHVIPPGTRIYCEGTALRPCPARAWWYHEGRRGRPQKRCTLCRLSQALIFKAESKSEHPALRCSSCGFALARTGGPGKNSPSYCICDLLA